jgi:hypothetical protein
MTKLVRSTRSLDEHVDNLLRIRELKNAGASDRSICRELNISYQVLKNYDGILLRKELAALSEDYQNEKRLLLDDQVLSIIGKLNEAGAAVEKEHETLVEQINTLLEDDKIDVLVKAKLRRFVRYPVNDIVQIQKLVLTAVELRSKIWGLDKEQKEMASITNNRKIVFQLNQKVETDTNKLNSIADSIIENTHGMRMQKEN